MDRPKQKERRRQESAALLKAAQRSPVDPQTGRVRCLSCGSVFGSTSGLAAHLQKHGGVNSAGYRPAQVVGTSHGIHRSHPMERPVHHFRDVLIMKQPVQKSRNRKDSQTGKGERSDVKGVMKGPVKDVKSKKKNKMTPIKRSILIHQVLSLTEKLKMLQREIETLAGDQHKDQQSSNVCSDLKRQMKKLQGCINASATELEMALTSINLKFTFRQLVMIEYLTNQMEILPSVSVDENEINPTSVDDDDVCEMEQNPVSDSMLKLYDEVERLEEDMEAIRDAEWKQEEMKVIETRRDPQSGKVYIRKPDFVDAPLNSVIEDYDVPQEEESVAEDDALRQDAVEIARCEDEGQMKDDESQHSLETSSDDDMWGFSDVLTDWAKQTQHAAKASRSNRELHVQMEDSLNPMPDAEKKQSNKEISPDSTESPSTGVHVVRVQKKSDKAANQTPADARTAGSGDDSHSGRDHQKVLNVQCIFIRPHLGIPCEQSYANPREDHLRKKSPRLSPSMAPSDLANNLTVSGASTVSPERNIEPAHETLDSAVYFLLRQLNARQHEHMKAGNGKANLRWIVSGFAEVNKYLSRDSVKLIIIARNLDASIQPKITETQLKAKERSVPVVTALSRKKIGQIYHYRKRMSVVAVLDYQHLENTYDSIIRLSQTTGA